MKGIVGNEKLETQCLVQWELDTVGDRHRQNPWVTENIEKGAHGVILRM